MKLITHYSLHKTNKGFTLTEMVVAMGIFIIALSIAVGGFLSVVRAQRAASSLMAVSDSMNITLERMMREMRTSYNFCNRNGPFHFGRTDCHSVPRYGVQFVNANNIVVRYILGKLDGALEPAIYRCTGDFVGGQFSCAPITAENVAVIRFNAELSGARKDDKRPPRVALRFQITSTDPQIRALNISISIQTVVSARCGPATLADEPGLACPSET